MSNELTTALSNNRELQSVEENMRLLVPRFNDLIGGSSGLSSDRLIQSLLVACEKNPKLLKCPLPSLISGALTFATLRLPIDGPSGQGFLIPFKNKGEMVAQPVIGYCGYNTIAGRSGMSINAGTVRQNDEIWDYMEGTGGYVKHKRCLNVSAAGDIIAFWAVAEARNRPPLVSILGIDQVNDIMAKSPAVKFGADTPWKDPKVGFPAMGEKSARRRLKRGMPWDVDEGRYVMAATMEEMFEERGLASGLNGPVLHVEGEENRLLDGRTKPAGPPPGAGDLMSPRLSDHEKNLRDAGDKAAAAGTNALKAWFLALHGNDKRLVEGYKDAALKKVADDKDKADISTFDNGKVT